MTCFLWGEPLNFSIRCGEAAVFIVGVRLSLLIKLYQSPLSE